MEFLAMFRMNLDIHLVDIKGIARLFRWCCNRELKKEK